MSAGIVVPGVQMAVDSLQYQFFIYAGVISLGGVWLWALPFIPEDIHSSPSGEMQALMMLRVAESSHSVVSLSEQESQADTFFMTSVAAASGASSSSLYCSLYGRSGSHLAGECGHSREAGLMLLGGSSRENLSLSARSKRTGTDEDLIADCVDIEADASTGPVEQVVQVEEGLSDGADSAGEGAAVEPPHYWTDMFISLMVLFIVGAGTSFSIYLETYVDQTAVINPSYKAMVLMVFFFSGTVANVAGIFMQISISDRSLARLAVFMLSVGAAGALLVLLMPQSANVLWGGVALFGFASAVTVGFCFNLANRLSYPSATSTSIIMIGSSVGVSIIPYITSLLISAEHFPGMVMLIGFVSMLLPILLLVLAIKCSYVNHNF